MKMMKKMAGHQYKGIIIKNRMEKEFE